MTRKAIPRTASWLWLSLAVVVLDQATKWLATTTLDPYRPLPVAPLLNFTLMFNDGAAFSLLSGAGGWQRWFFVGFALLMSIALTVWLLRSSPGDRLLAIALSLIVGGAVGNLIDRLRTGRVVDFIQVYAGDWYWPAFNIADSAISIGVVLMLSTSLRAGREGHGGEP